ncbi:restriction endonuclease subunit S [Aeromonas veronii]|uniref:restriction endonuclease subunit S n=1 Tax=Aeromonas veronii TaxID=654 RepID=UPI00111A350D|nr:restriction endonuclease subunit S [Aeromonas veronii]MCX0421868.1 restriction endonuclease subunit S [Aeromonas veronii]TNI70693.1 hypothetical protein CF109_18540 [Aeromonas veronii]WIJ41091.1 restriction endonuclease subunit S [Aeromonas veronii]
MIAAEPKTTGQYQPYPEYKNTGLTWLGAIPNHWGLKRAKFVFKRVQRPVRVEDDIVTAFRDGQVTLRSNRRTEGFTNALQEIGYQGVRSGDLLIHAMDGFAGAIGISDSEGKCSPVCSVCIPISAESVNPYYYGYLVRQLAVTGFITSLSKGIRERSTEFRFSEFSPLELAVPPVNEQHIIAAFLDYETARIDRLIAQQQRLIELLKEKRQAEISHAVTKGLNPNAPMKDSGVEWLGQVPEHWVIPQIGYLCNVTKLTGFEYTNYWEPDDSGEIIALRGYNIGERILDLEKKTEKISRKLSKKLARSKLHQGDVVMPCTGTLGNAAVIPKSDTFHINQNIAKLTFSDVINPDYACYWVTSNNFRRMIDHNNTSGMQPVLLIGDIRNMRIPVPPSIEQSEIVCYLNRKTAKFEAVIENGFKLLSLLQERRSALISAAVTGKIDLRGWTPPAEEAAA